jgi:uncharacterized protein (DUF433 family)
MSGSVDIGTLIDRDPKIREGRPKIAGTGVTVMRIAGWHNQGWIPEEIAANYQHISLAQVHAALAYYHANKEEIDADIEAEEGFYEASMQLQLR